MTPGPSSSVGALLSAWRADAGIASNIVTWETIPARLSQTLPFPEDLHPALRRALQQSGYTSLYTHQHASWESLRAGRSIVVVTGTASGKTLCYNLPVIDRLIRDPKARALYIFPTKALAQDQSENLDRLIGATARASQEEGGGSVQIGVATYDGDTSASLRPAIRTKSRLIITNPDMLHTGVLPHHTLWAEYFRNLQFVVIDEIHSYRGVFGSHVANVMRRLERVARFYGASPQFILTSATIANPVELGERLVGVPLDLIDNDGSARGAKHFLMYNPPIVNRELGIRRSSLLESTKLAGVLANRGIQTIVFGRARRTVEVMLTYLRQNLPEVADRIRGYRSGYLPAERREIERGLRDGSVRAVVATNALELGIDIGSMDAAILVGYPGTVAATLQQSGRAGRKNDASLSILVTAADPLDQFLARHPEYFFERSPEQALINPDNLLILLQHLRCAAFELPFRRGEGFGNLPSDLLAQFLQVLEEGGEIHESGDRFFWMADQYPSSNVSLRSASPDSVLLQVQEDEGWHTIGQVDAASAPWLVHPKAVYLHDGQSYLVEELDQEQNIAHLRKLEMDYYTEPRAETTVEKETLTAEQPALGCQKSYGDILVTSQLAGFRKVKWYTHEYLASEQVTLPPTQLHTTGYWLTVSDETIDVLREQGLWTNDANDYGPDWPTIRDRVRARDGYRCQICHMPEAGRSHHVHHKVPFRTFASAEQANQLDNLITLCPTCHRLAETAVRMRSGLAGLSYALSNLAPFFLMCDAGDLGVYFEPQAPISDGHPTVVLYDMVPAGIGFSERLFDLHDELMRRAYQLVSECECTDGCPSCVGAPGENGEGGKQETLGLLKVLAGVQ